MTMMAAIRSVCRQYARFSGRAPRAEFWWWILFTTLVSVVLGSIPVGPTRMTYGMWMSHGMWMQSQVSLGSLWGLAVLVPTLAVCVRRLRDAGYGWGHLLWLLIPGVGLIILAVLCAQPTVGSGATGAHPDVPPLGTPPGFGSR